MNSEPPFLNRHADIRMSARDNFPHWNQDNKLQFVTFRLADSLPQSTIAEIKYRQELFCQQHPKPWDDDTELQFQSIPANYAQKLLDNGYGECILRKKEARDIIVETLLNDHGVKYALWSVVIMPNHVHMIIQIYDGFDLQQIIGTIKSITSHKINKLTGKCGKIWTKNYYDRIIRDDVHYQNCLSYIINNPSFLPPSAYTLLRLR